MTGSHRDPRLEAESGEPRAVLRQSTRLQIIRLLQGPEHPLAQGADACQDDLVGEWRACGRAQCFNAVVHRACSRSHPQLGRRVNGESRVENDRDRHHLGMEENLLQPVAFIRDKRCCIVFAAIQRGWHRDLSDLGRPERRDGDARSHGEGIEARFIADVMFHRHDDDLGEIDRRPPADGDDQIGSCVLGLTGNLGSLLARSVLCNSVEGPDVPPAERTPDLLYLVGLGVQGSTDEKEDALDVQSFRLIFQSVRRSFAINDAIDCWKIMDPGFAHFWSSVNLWK